MAKPGISAAQFRKSLARYSKKVEEQIVAEVHGVVVREIHKRILERTPVLTGKARRNWNLSFNAPDPEITDEVAGVKTTGEPITASERARAQQTLVNIKFAKIGGTMWIANFLPYIWFLENGSSLKAPEGIVEGAIQGALEDIQSKGVKSKVRS